MASNSRKIPIEAFTVLTCSDQLPSRSAANHLINDTNNLLKVHELLIQFRFLLALLSTCIKLLTGSWSGSGLFFFSE